MLEKLEGAALFSQLEILINTRGDWQQIILEESKVAQNLIHIINALIDELHSALGNLKPDDDSVCLFKKWVNLFISYPEFLIRLNNYETNNNNLINKLNMANLILLLTGWDGFFTIGSELLKSIPVGQLNLDIDLLKDGLYEFSTLEYLDGVEDDGSTIFCQLMIDLSHHVLALGEMGKKCWIEILTLGSYIKLYVNSDLIIPSNWPIEIITCDHIFLILEEMINDINDQKANGLLIDHFGEREYTFIHNSLTSYERENDVNACPVFSTLKALVVQFAELLNFSQTQIATNISNTTTAQILGAVGGSNTTSQQQTQADNTTPIHLTVYENDLFQHAASPSQHLSVTDVHPNFAEFFIENASSDEDEDSLNVFNLKG